LCRGRDLAPPQPRGTTAQESDALLSAGGGCRGLLGRDALGNGVLVREAGVDEDHAGDLVGCRSAQSRLSKPLEE
jgi:hypothetical protein